MKKQFFLGVLILNLAILIPIISYGAEETNTLLDESNSVSSEQNIVAESDAILDENISANDLNIKEQSVLPTNPFYFFKNTLRGIKSAFTFDPVKKAELKLRFADERLIEAKKVAENIGGEKAFEIVNKAMEKYEKEVGFVKERIEKFENIDKEKVENFIERFTDHQIKQQKLINNIEDKLTANGVSPEKIENIIEHKKKAMEHFANGALSAVDPEILKEKLEKAMSFKEGDDSIIKRFRNLEILNNLEEQIPEEAREAIKQTQENIRKKVNETLSTSEKSREGFRGFIGNSVSHDSLNKLKVIEELDVNNLDFNIKKVLNDAREETLNKVRDKFEGIENSDTRDKLFERLKAINEKDLNLIDKLENRLSDEALQKLREAKERAIENRGNIERKLEKGINKGTDVIQNVKDKVRAIEVKDNIRVIPNNSVAIPKNIKEKINNSGIFNQVEKRKDDLEELKDDSQEKLENSIESLKQKVNNILDSNDLDSK